MERSMPTATSSSRPDLWETYLEPKYRDRALRIVRDETAWKSSRSAASARR